MILAVNCHTLKKQEKRHLNAAQVCYESIESKQESHFIQTLINYKLSLKFCHSQEHKQDISDIIF